MKFKNFNNLKIRKASGEFESFSPGKFYHSLKKAGLPQKEAKNILQDISPKIKRGISTKRLFQLARNRIKSSSHAIAAHYGLQRALLELGPEGFIFEKFMAKMLELKGYKTTTNNFCFGNCVRHEIDIIAENKDSKVFIECKFHNRAGLKNELKTALYVFARSLDIKNNSENNMTHFWLISNTKFTSDALQYAECAGLTVISPNSRRPYNLYDWFSELNVRPISTLTSLKRRYLHQLFSHEVFFIEEILANPNLLKICKMSFHEQEAVLNEINKIMINGN